MNAIIQARHKLLKMLVLLLNRCRWARSIAVRAGVVSRMQVELAKPIPFVSGAQRRLIDHWDLGVIAGEFRVPSSDEIVFEQVFYANQLVSFVKRLNCDPAAVRTIIDAGANVGFSAIYLARIFPNAKIVALEPDGENCRQARINLFVNGITSVKLIRAALWHERRALAVIRPEGDLADYSLQVGPKDAFSSGREVPGLTFGDVLESEGWDQVDLLKLDIEGAEAALFRPENLGWLDKVRALSVEPHVGYTTHEGLGEILRQRGMEVHHVGELVFAGVRVGASGAGTLQQHANGKMTLA